jgi:hypothetical protein
VLDLVRPVAAEQIDDMHSEMEDKTHTKMNNLEYLDHIKGDKTKGGYHRLGHHHYEFPSKN